jgi:hypothetical protein
VNVSWERKSGKSGTAPSLSLLSFSGKLDTTLVIDSYVYASVAPSCVRDNLLALLLSYDCRYLSRACLFSLSPTAQDGFHSFITFMGCSKTIVIVVGCENKRMGNEHSIGGNLDSDNDTKLQAGDDVVVPRESPTSCVTWPATTPNGSNANNTSAFSAFVPTETTTTTAPVVPDETPQSHDDIDNQNEEVVQALRLERDALQTSLAQAQAQRTKMQGKLRSKSARIRQLEAQLVKARTEAAAATANVARLADEKESMRAGLVCLAATRDDYKARWQMQRQISQDLRGQVAATQQRTKAAVARQQREAELLALYRTLSLRTGYQQMGKAIRTLEHELASLVVADEE